jgi:hypothetical protein
VDFFLAAGFFAVELDGELDDEAAELDAGAVCAEAGTKAVAKARANAKGIAARRDARRAFVKGCVMAGPEPLPRGGR